MYFTKTTLSAALVAAVNGHMIMKQPAPFDPSGLNNSPLDASGSDFPCKFNGAYTATGGTTNVFGLGSSQPLSFTGSAVHGGGSCQVSITYDNPPTKNSKWKVIHSIEGGCPARNTAGNLTPNPDSSDPFTYQFKIPTDIPEGNGTIAWTWFNRIGNREMYMNCGPLTLTGSGGDQSNFDKLPDMVVLNIGGHPQTIEGVDYKFTDPGSSVEDNTGAYGVATCGNNGCTKGDTAGSGSSSGSGSGSGAGSAPASTAGSGNILQPSGNSGAAAPTSAAPAPTSAAPAPTSVAPAPSSAAPAPISSAAPVGSGSGSSSGTMSGPCTSEGMWNCIGGKSFQQCGSGMWTAMTAMPAGTVCSPGQSMELGMVAAGRRVRSFRM
ncbi:hypothetical protein GGR50DRAFT_499572 [Xylaria sp. CBS 124048]|nr:hypothetical protein GGR50DRAFT_499572 [Xylaria sp. CBS 124048]